MRTLLGIGMVLAAAAGALLPAALAQDEYPAKIASASAEPAAVAPGGTVEVRVDVTIDAPYHVYGLAETTGLPSEFVAPEAGWPAGLTAGKPTETPAAKIHDVSGMSELIHEGSVRFTLPFTVAADAASGAREISGALQVMACDATGCLRARPLAFAVRFDVALGAAIGPAVVAPLPPPAPAQQADPQVKTPKEKSSLGEILLSGIGWGLLTVLTPCVFPLLPVTVSFFSKQQGPPLPRSLVYSAGIVFTIMVIGLIFKSSLDFLARGTAFNLFVAILFIVLALSLFGLFELRLPSFLIDRSQQKSASGGLAGPFFMAVTLALTSFSCSIPFLAIMFTSFEKGEHAHALLGLLAYSLTLALPFFLCSLFPTLLKTLPRSGGWLNAVKVTMGFVEFGLAFKFLRTVALNEGSDLLSRPLVLAIWTACALAAALYLFGYITLPHDTRTESIGVVRLLFALFFLAMAAWFMAGTIGRPLNPTLDGFIQTEEKDLLLSGSGRGGGESEHIAWGKNDWAGALAQSQRDGRAVLVDFTGVG